MSNDQQQHHPPASPLDQRQVYLNQHSQRSEYQGNIQRVAFEQDANMAQNQMRGDQVENPQGQVDGGSHEFTIQFDSMQRYCVYPSHEQDYVDDLIRNTDIGQTVAGGIDDGPVRDRSGMPVGISYEARPLMKNEHVHRKAHDIGSVDSMCIERSATPALSEPDTMTTSMHSNPPCDCRCRRVKTWTDTPQAGANQVQEGDDQYPQELVIEEQ